MPSFICDVTKQRARSRDLSQTGTLTLQTCVEVRGNYQSGPVPVTILHKITFVPDKEFWEHDDTNPEECYAVAHEKGFNTTGERDAYCRTFYEILSHGGA